MIATSYLFESKGVTIKKLDSDQERKQFVNKFKDNGAFSRYLNNDCDFYAAIDNNILIGGIILNHNPTQVANTYSEVALSLLYVMPDYRGEGVASKLLEIPVKKYKSITTTTGKFSDDQSQHLYKKFGFKVVGQKGKTKYWHWTR